MIISRLKIRWIDTASVLSRKAYQFLSPKYEVSVKHDSSLWQWRHREVQGSAAAMPPANIKLFLLKFQAGLTRISRQVVFRSTLAATGFLPAGRVVALGRTPTLCSLPGTDGYPASVPAMGSKQV